MVEVLTLSFLNLTPGCSPCENSTLAASSARREGQARVFFRLFFAVSFRTFAQRMASSGNPRSSCSPSIGALFGPRTARQGVIGQRKANIGRVCVKRKPFWGLARLGVDVFAKRGRRDDGAARGAEAAKPFGLLRRRELADCERGARNAKLVSGVHGLGGTARMAKRFSRREMFDLVWSMPMRTLAAKVGLSDVGLKKAVVSAGLPVPPQSHWNRVLAGGPTALKPELPPRGFGASDEIRIGGDRWFAGDQQSERDEPPLEPVFDEPMDSVRRRAERAVGRVSAPRDLSASSHPAIRRILADEEKLKAKAKEAPYAAFFYRTRFDSPIDQRRLRLLNSIALGVSKAGISVRLARLEDATLEVRSSGAVSLSLIAKKMIVGGERAERDTRISIAMGSEPDRLRVGDAGRWDDLEARKLETIVSDIAVEIVVRVEEQYRDAQFRHHKWLLARRAEEVEAARKAKIEAERRERERLKKLERERIEQLLADADQLRRAQAIRAYVAEVERLPNAVESGENFEQWRAWALSQADRIDPVKNGSLWRSIEDRTQASRKTASEPE
jgi:hypothetical protein